MTNLRPGTDDDVDAAGYLAFRARALAQAHPLTRAALAYRAGLIDQERRDQPVSEVADWAATAFLVGYCVRRVEEADGGLPRAPGTGGGRGIDRDQVQAIARRLSDGEAATVADRVIVVDALDRVIASEVAKRHEHVLEHLDPAEWAAFEDYVAWWVLHGWATRVAEEVGTVDAAAGADAGPAAGPAAGPPTCASS